MSIKQLYYYLFYKFYKFSKVSNSIFPNDLAAAFAIDWLEMILLSSIYFYLTPFIGRHGDIQIISLPVLVPLLVIYVINHFAFIHNKKWKKYNHEFEQYSLRKNRIGAWFTAGVIIFILVNFGFSVYIMRNVPVTH